MTTDSLKSILYACEDLDVLASKLYTKLVLKSNTTESKAFWQEMAAQERDHVRFWKSAIEFSAENTIPNIFEDDGVVLAELGEAQQKASRLLESLDHNTDSASFFLTAYWMEFYLLYPSFNVIFHYMGILSEGINPEEEYEKHLVKFVEGFERFGNVSPEMELLGSILNSLWKRNNELVKMSMYDPLTRIFNRKGISDLMISYGSLAQRNDYSVGIMMIDVDNFKSVNDNFGHQAGDLVLVEIAHRLQSNIRKADLLGRFGGDEFILFFSNTDEDLVKKLANKLGRAVSDSPIHNISMTISVGGSVGKIDSNDIGESLGKMISKADSKLYGAKEKGRNRYEL